MKLTVPYIKELTNTSIKDCGAILERAGVCSTIENVNWRNEYPYRPIVQFQIARSGNAFYIKYNVKGVSLKAVYSQDQSNVHEDSCVEFFCKKEEDTTYRNFEFNCIGTCSASIREGRKENVQPFSPEEMSTIERYSNIGTKVFKEIEGDFEWELTVKIPFTLIGLDPENLPEKILGNFYKCADDTAAPHFVSWAPIATQTPDFHRPEFFGEIFL